MPPKKSSGGAKAGKSKSGDDASGDKGKGEKKGCNSVKVFFFFLLKFYFI